MMEEECPAELSTSQKENGKGILKDLRTIRDAVLSKQQAEKTFLLFTTKPLRLSALK